MHGSHARSTHLQTITSAAAAALFALGPHFPGEHAAKAKYAMIGVSVGNDRKEEGKSNSIVACVIDCSPLNVL